MRIHPDDNVAVAIRPLVAGEEIEVAGVRVPLREDVPAGHKVALDRLDVGTVVVKYGFPIGAMTAPSLCPMIPSRAASISGRVRR